MITLIVIVIGMWITRLRVSTIATACAAAASVKTKGDISAVIAISHEHHNTYNSGVS